VIDGKSVIAIVPARAGSKGLPGKNIRDLCGQPLIAWSIQAGLGSSYVDVVMVTTDSPEIAAIAKAFGAVVPFMRPAELASDTATSFDVIRHALEFYKTELKRSFDYVVLLEPTSPLRDKRDVDAALRQLLNETKATAIAGICKTESQNPAFLVRRDAAGFIKGYENPGMKVLRRQDIADVFFFEGSVYISETEALIRHKTFYHTQTVGYEVPKWKSFEIDDLEDFVVIEALMNFKEIFL
jgi:N-acylneuraminate cytidylyltransferase/CMP-N,N'-diacetyllegionaminic acid synthase